jgi:hypothetical protein
MGNAIKTVASKTMNFFAKVAKLIKTGVQKIGEVIVNGVKKVVSYFKKIIEYSYNGVKIVGKLIAALGKQLVHTLTFKKGIPHLIDFYNELKSRNVKIKSETGEEVKPDQFFENLAQQMGENDQLRVKTEIIKTEQSQDQSVCDFEEDDEDDLSFIQGLNEKDSCAKIGDKEVSLDNISRDDTNCEEENK